MRWTLKLVLSLLVAKEIDRWYVTLSLAIWQNIVDQFFIIFLILNSNVNLSLEMVHTRSRGKTMNNVFNIFYSKCIRVFLLMFVKDQKWAWNLYCLEIDKLHKHLYIFFSLSQAFEIDSRGNFSIPPSFVIGLYILWLIKLSYWDFNQLHSPFLKFILIWFNLLVIIRQTDIYSML